MPLPKNSRKVVDVLLSILRSVLNAFERLLKASSMPQRDYSFSLNSTEKQNSTTSPSLVGVQLVDSDSHGEEYNPMDFKLECINVIEAADDGKYRKLIKPDKVLIHRIGPKLNCNSKECDYCESANAITNSEHNFGLHVSKWFQSHPRIGLTGGGTPYHFVIGYSKTFQCLPLKDCGVHARRWNTKALAIAVQGDFNHEHPTAYQKYAVDLLSASLCRFLGAVDVWGHTELPEATKDPMKRCPGAYMYMHNRRIAIRQLWSENKCREIPYILEEYNIAVG